MKRGKPTNRLAALAFCNDSQILCTEIKFNVHTTFTITFPQQYKKNGRNSLPIESLGLTLR